MKNIYRYRILQLLYLLGFVFFITAEGEGQTIRVRGGNVIFPAMTTGTPGGQLTPPATNIATSLRYSTPNNPNILRKISVSTSCTPQHFNLSVLATNVTRGAAAPAVSLVTGNPAIDFIRDIPRNSNNARATLNYTASATFNQGIGTDSHTVTYTIQAQ
jgi:hypothetical protein